jgi:hypothetical protein
LISVFFQGNCAKTIIQAIQEFKAQKHHFRMMQQQQQQQQQHHQQMSFNQMQPNWNGPPQNQPQFNNNDMFGGFGHQAQAMQQPPQHNMFPVQQPPQQQHFEAFTVL